MVTPVLLCLRWRSFKQINLLIIFYITGWLVCKNSENSDKSQVLKNVCQFTASVQFYLHTVTYVRLATA